MTRWLRAAAYLATGLIVTWGGFWLGSRMEFRLPQNWMPSFSVACPEMGVCDQPGWVVAVFLGYVFTPSIIWALAGWRSAPGSRHVRNVAAMTAVTLAFYLLGYALSPK